MSANDLVKKPEDPEADEVLGIVESSLVVTRDLANDSNWQDPAIDGVMIGIDALSIVMNPLGELVKVGVGWLMEHIDFIREPLEVLTGDPKQVDAIAGTWENIAKRIEEMTTEYQAAMTLTESWIGDAASGYRGVAHGYIAALAQIAGQAKDAANGVKLAGVVVGTERAIIFDLISTFITDVITRALLAVASSWFTFGASVGAFVASVIADAAQLAAKLQKRLGKLLHTIQQFVSKYHALGDKSVDAAQALGRRSTELGREANKVIKESTTTLDGLAPQSGRLKSYTDYAERRADSGLGRALDSTAAKVAKEGAKSINNTLNPDE